LPLVIAVSLAFTVSKDALVKTRIRQIAKNNMQAISSTITTITSGSSHKVLRIADKANTKVLITDTAKKVIVIRYGTQKMDKGFLDTSKATNIDTPKSIRTIIRETSGNQRDPLIVIDGALVDKAGKNFELESVNPEDISAITVLKGDHAATNYGPDAAKGVILITTKPGEAQRRVQDILREQRERLNNPEMMKEVFPVLKASQNRLILIDGKEAGSQDVEKLLPDQIEKINFLNDAETKKQYGEKAKNGVIIITTKK
jgi:TonB-dependent SusC/RagA subfamily outer membrane receptor